MILNVEEVQTKEDLVLFVAELSKRAAQEPESWQNVTLPMYLDALSGWLDSMEGAFQTRGMEVPENPSWQLVARMLNAATIYE